MTRLWPISKLNPGNCLEGLKKSVEILRTSDIQVKIESRASRIKQVFQSLDSDFWCYNKIKNLSNHAQVTPFLTKKKRR